MRKMSTAQKASSNRLTTSRTRRKAKRQSHLKVLKAAEGKINLTRKQISRMIYFRNKYNKQKTPPDGSIIL
jgi:hypothetical protein